MPLTDAAMRKAKPSSKQFKMTDGGGMYLPVNKAGKYFRLDYRFAGKHKNLALGVYPEVNLKEARERREEARHMLANGLNSGEVKKMTKVQRIERAANSFEAVAREWFVKQSPN